LKLLSLAGSGTRGRKGSKGPGCAEAFENICVNEPGPALGCAGGSGDGAGEKGGGANGGGAGSFAAFSPGRP
jgi:hypothetical protein